MLAAWRHGPALSGNDFLFPEDIGARAPIKDAAPVHPTAEAGRYGDVGGSGDDALRERLLAAGQVRQDSTEPFLRRQATFGRKRQRVGYGQCGRASRTGPLLRERNLRKKGAELLFRHGKPCEWLPFFTGSD